MKNRTETARVAVRRKKLLGVLENETPAWKDADHPELGRIAAEFVRDLRPESDSRETLKPLEGGGVLDIPIISERHPNVDVREKK